MKTTYIVKLFTFVIIYILYVLPKYRLYIHLYKADKNKKNLKKHADLSGEKGTSAN